MNTCSLPGITEIGIVPKENIPINAQAKALAKIPIGLYSTPTPVYFVGKPTCEVKETNGNNGCSETATLQFDTLEELSHNIYAVAITDANNNRWLLGSDNYPYINISISKTTGSVGGDSAMSHVEITLIAKKALIKVAF